MDKRFKKIQKPMIGALLLLWTGVAGQNVDFDWAARFGSSSSDFGEEITNDNSGHIIVIGDFHGTVDFDPNNGINNITSQGMSDAFVVKLDTAKNLIWAISFQGAANVYGNSVITDNADNIYVVGDFEGTVDFNPGISTTNITSTGNRNIYVCKLTPNGELRWVKQFGGSIGNDSGTSICLDTSANVYIAGKYINGNEEVFIAKLDSAGTIAWSNIIGGSSDDLGYDLTTDSNSNIYVTGLFRNTVDFDPSGGIINLTANGNYDTFISKYNTDGGFVWVKQFAGVSTGIAGQGRAISLDNNCDVVIGGDFNGSTDFDPSNSTFILTPNGGSAYSDIFICKLDTLGNFINAINLGGVNSERCDDIYCDPFNNIYFTGSFEGTVDFDYGIGNAMLNEMGSNGDVYVCKYNSDLNYQFAIGFGDTDFDIGRSIIYYNGSVFTVGYFKGTVDFDIGFGVDNIISNGETDAFIQKLIDNTCANIDTSVTELGSALQANATGVTYQWLDCDNNYALIGGATQRLFDPASSSGFYAVVVSDGACADTSNCHEVIAVGINETKKAIKIYPNPVKSELTVNGYSPVYLKLCNAVGQTVAESTSNKLYVGNLTQGLYVLQLFDAKGQQVKTEKVIVAK